MVLSKPFGYRLDLIVGVLDEPFNAFFVGPTSLQSNAVLEPDQSYDTRALIDETSQVEDLPNSGAAQF